MFGDLGIEVACVGPVGRAVGLDFEIAAMCADADEFDYIARGRGLIAEKAFFETNLRLRA
ncbi:hypothetical protein D3C87_1946950 [compost metagenome]